MIDLMYVSPFTGLKLDRKGDQEQGRVVSCILDKGHTCSLHFFSQVNCVYQHVEKESSVPLDLPLL